jgi:peptidoglycan/xylan/chitin deacetylase (PgdA/CDA1 family)
VNAARHAALQLSSWMGLGGGPAAGNLDPSVVTSLALATAGRAIPSPGAWEPPALHESVEAIAARLREAALAQGRPHVEIERWPDARPFAVALTHDVDQVHDRGLYRTLADLNHLRKVLGGAEPGRARACAARVARSLLRPVNGRVAFRRIREIESRHGWTSTFFFLEGHEGRRYGARYSLDDPRVREVAEYLLAEGCEIGVHGGYYDLDDARGYRRSADAVGRAFGVEVQGIRNHYLRWRYPETWRAQVEAGFRYDATFGRAEKPGFRGGVPLPFQPWDDGRERALDLVVLPLTVMDGTLFRTLGLDLPTATGLLAEVLDAAHGAGALVSLLWHNNFFAEEEYAEWEGAYADTLAAVARRGAWCGRADCVADWWSRRSAVGITEARTDLGGWAFRVTSRLGIEGLALRLSLPPGSWRVRVDDGERRDLLEGRETVHLPRLLAGESAGVSVHPVA